MPYVKRKQSFTIMLCCSLLLGCLIACGARPVSSCEGGIVYPHTPWLASANGMVYLGAYDMLYGLNAQNGHVSWQYQIKLVQALLSGNDIYAWSDSDTLYALNATTGKVLWHRAVAHISGASFLVADGVLYVAANSGGGITAFRTSDGSLLWLYVVGQGKMTLQVVHDILYVANCAEVLALQVADGSLAWKYTLHQQCSLQNLTPMVIEPPYIFVQDSHLNALRIQDGTLLWSLPTVEQFAAAHGVLYALTHLRDKNRPTAIVPFAHQLLAVRKNDGTRLWQSPYFTGSGDQDLFVMNNVLFTAGRVPSTFVTPYLAADEAEYQDMHAFKAANGTKVWTQLTAQHQVELRLDTKHIYTLSDTALSAINIQDGTQSWLHKLTAYKLLLDGGGIYAGSGGNVGDGCNAATNSTLLALRTNNGGELWHFTSASGSGATLK